MTNITTAITQKLREFGESVSLEDYDLSAPYPHPSDKLLDQIWDSVSSVSFGDVDDIRASIDVELAAKMMGYSRRMAVYALREREPNRIRFGLQSLSLDDDLLDIRDVFRAVVLHFDACRKLDISFAELFEVGLRLATENRRERISSQFLRGPDYTKSIQAMKFTFVETDDGPLYIDGLFTWPT